MVTRIMVLSAPTQCVCVCVCQLLADCLRIRAFALRRSCIAITTTALVPLVLLSPSRIKDLISSNSSEISRLPTLLAFFGDTQPHTHSLTYTHLVLLLLLPCRLVGGCLHQPHTHIQQLGVIYKHTHI